MKALLKENDILRLLYLWSPEPCVLLKEVDWLSTFQYRTVLSIWPFVIAMVTSIGITVITVTLRSFRAANANTIDALKYE